MSGSRSRVFLALSALVVVGVLATAFFLGGFKTPASSSADARDDATATAPPDATPAVAEATGGTKTRDAATAHAPGATRASEPLHPPAYEKALSGIVGRIVEPTGEPVRNAQVQLLGGMLDFLTADVETLLFAPEKFDPRIEEQRVRTNADGRFRFTRVDPRAYYLIGVNLGGAGRPLLRFLDVTPNPGEVCDLGDLALDPPLALTGMVVDRSSRPVAGARVEASPFPSALYMGGALTYEPGSALIAKQSNLQILATAPPFLERILALLPIPATTTGADGRFRIDGAPSGPLSLVVHKSGLAPLAQPLPATKLAEKEIGEVLLDPGDELEGLVVDETGKPIANAEVRVATPIPVAPDEAAIARPAIFADAAGRFAARGLTGDSVVIAARAPGIAAWTITKRMELSGDLVTVTIPAPRSMLVRVLDGASKPLAARIAVQSWNSLAPYVPQLAPPIRPTITTIEPGLYRVEGLTKGRYLATAKAAGHAIARGEAEIDEGPEPEVTLTLDAELRVRVTVLAKQDGRIGPLEGAQVFASSEEGMDKLGLSSLGSANSGADGVAFVSTPVMGEALLFATHPGYAATTQKISLPETREATLQLLVGGTIEGRVVRDGQPIGEPRWVTLVPEEMESPDGALSVTPPRFAMTDLHGAFRFTHVGPCEYEIVVMNRVFGRDLTRMGDEGLVGVLFGFGEEDRAKAKTTVVDEATANVVIDLATGGRQPTPEDGKLRGVVTRNGEPYPRATLFLSGPEEWRQRRTDEQGKFDFGPVKAGQFQLTVMGSNRENMQQLATKQVKVDVGLESVVEIHVETAGPLRGVVLDDETGRPLAGAQVMAWRQRDPKDAMTPEEAQRAAMYSDWEGAIQVMTDGQGRFEIEDVPIGTLGLRASLNGHAPAMVKNIAVARGLAPEFVTIRLPRGVTAAGRVSFEGLANGGHFSLQFRRTDVDDPIEMSCEVEAVSGAFTMGGLMPGKYRVHLIAFIGGPPEVVDPSAPDVDWEDGYWLSEQVELTVPSRGVSDAQLALKRAPKAKATPAEPVEEKEKK